MATNVFVYGTLLVPEMMQAVAGREFQAVPATVFDYARYFLRGRVYPGISAQPASQVAGLVYLDVDAEAIARLDYFEGPEYVREQLQVVRDIGAPLVADAYVVPTDRRNLLDDRPWSLDDFVESGLADFIAHARQCMLEFKPGEQVRR